MTLEKTKLSLVCYLYQSKWRKEAFRQFVREKYRMLLTNEKGFEGMERQKKNGLKSHCLDAIFL